MRIPLIEDMATGPIPAGSSLLVEYDPASQWYDASLTILAGWLKTGGKVSYKSQEKFSIDSLKVANLSIWWSKHRMVGQPTPSVLRIVDDLSGLARANDEKTWVEFMVTRIVPSAAVLKSTRIVGVISGVHSEWAYKTLEAAHDGIIDLKLEEAGEETRVLMRIRSLRNVGFDRRWHRLSFADNFEVSLDKKPTGVR
jgi:hypothetical protein